MQNRRAHECAAGLPVERDRRQLWIRPCESQASGLETDCALSADRDMQRLTLDTPIPDALRGAIVALGNFDGFHLGHQAVVGRAVQRGAHERRPVIVATFDPHPVRHFRPDAPPFRLTTPRPAPATVRRGGGRCDAGVRLRRRARRDHARRISSPNCWRSGSARAGVVTGEDFTFGKARGGNADGAARPWRRARDRRRDRSRRWRSTASRCRRAGSARR